jgi:hypothetical protein
LITSLGTVRGDFGSYGLAVNDSGTVVGCSCAADFQHWHAVL